MTAQIKHMWHIINKVLTIINLILFGALTFNIVMYKEIRDTRVPPLANILLLIFLGLGLFAAIYKLRYS